MGFLNPAEHEKMLASLFYGPSNTQYATKYVMGKLWVKGDEKALKRMEKLRSELEEEFGVDIIRLQHMANLSNDLSCFFELEDGRTISVFSLRERLDKFIFDIHETVNEAKSMDMGF